MPQGTIKKIMVDKGFGFITTEKGDYFFHETAVHGVAFDDLRVGQVVEFVEGQGPKGPRAEQVKPT
jgi:CspA family cold shock protein